MDNAEIYLRWEKNLKAEWAKKDAISSYIKADREKVYHDFIMEKLITLFTMAEINGQRLAKLENANGL
jgi:hypothetical protein